jgi:nucleoside phosphorylase
MDAPIRNPNVGKEGRVSQHDVASVERLLSARELFDVACCREGDLDQALLDVHPSPTTVDILALTPAILAKQRDLLLRRMKQGCSVRLLITRGMASLMWGGNQEGFLAKFDELAAFQGALGAEGLSDLFGVREMDWTPSVGMIVINGRSDDGVAWVSIHTPSPKSPSRDKTCLEFSRARSAKLFEFFAAEFRALWSEASAVSISDERSRWEALRTSVNEGTRRLLAVIAHKSPDVRDFGFVIAMSEEFRHFVSTMGPMECDRDERTGQHYYSFNCGKHRCVAILLGRMGKTSAAQMVERLTQRYSVGTIVNIGIAGGIGGDVRVGDVIVASQVDDYLHRAKASPARLAPPLDGEEDFVLRGGGAAFPTSYQLVSEIMHLEFSRPEVQQAWIGECEERARKALESSYEAAAGHLSVRCPPRLHADDVHLASGDVVTAAPRFIAWIRGRDRNVMAVDMEAGGVISAAHASLLPVRTLVVRGISDPSDESKEELEKVFGGQLREMAMTNACLLLKSLLMNNVLPGI